MANLAATRISSSLVVETTASAALFIGVLSGTASYATYAVNTNSASYAVTASYVSGSSVSSVSASYANTASVATFALSATSASYAISASYEIVYETSASYADYASNAGSASFATTASYALNANVGSSDSASWASSSISASYADTASCSRLGSAFILSPARAETGEGGELSIVTANQSYGKNWVVDSYQNKQRLFLDSGSNIYFVYQAEFDRINFTTPITASGVRANLEGTASYALNTVQLNAKRGMISGSSFTGSPKSYDITFSEAFDNDIYVVSVVGTEARVWSVSNMSATGFTIDSNSNQDITGFVMYRAEEI
jgi:hypothetical protein